jgi:catechol 2,3-dioxygenase-like lactoylglutathione lyase family enzyme
VILLWHIDDVVAIPKSVKQHRIKENFDVFDFPLTADEVASIDALDTGVRGGPLPESISPATFTYKVMDITIHASFLPHNDPDASLAIYRDTLGFKPYGVRDCAVRDPAGNLIRIQELR